MKNAICANLALSLILGLNVDAATNNDDRTNPAPAAIEIDNGAQPDLVVRIACPRQANPGDDIGWQIRQEAMNRGDVVAPGTIGRLDPANGYMIDFVLSTDRLVPDGLARVSRDFREDMLLEGGRTSRTVDLFPGDRTEYPVGTRIPQHIQPGSYFICARIDPGDRIAESNERNNTTCFPIEIGQPPPPSYGIGGDRRNEVPHYRTEDGPDLVVSEFSISPATQGEPVSVHIGVYNQGNRHTGPFTVQWWPGENFREPAKTWFVEGLRAGGGRILSFTYGGYPSWYGRIRTKVVVDAAGDVAESDGRNNTRTLTISVRRR